jgi:hypothetical protein
MSETASLTAAPAKKKSWRRRRLFVVALVLLPFLALAGVYFYIGHLADVELQDAQAEADRLDPGWRLDDLLARRPEYAADDNSALQVLRSKALIPKGWTVKQDITRPFYQMVPRSLDAQQRKPLRQEMDKVGAALVEARKLADMPHGCFPIQGSEDWLHGKLASGDALEVARLLELDALLLAQEGDADGALRSTRGLLNVGRAVGDEPALYSQLIRLVCWQQAVGCLARVLARGEPSPAALAELQRVQEEEEAANPMLHALRGERAGHEHTLEKVQNGSVRVADFLAPMKASQGMKPEFMLLLYSSSSRKNQRAAMLRILTQFVETAKLPPEQQPRKYKELDTEIEKHGLLVRFWLPLLTRYLAHNQPAPALMRCATVAVAMERYRRAHEAWPASLEALVADGLLKHVPTDPYDGAPLRYRVCEDRVVIYSVGQDLQDNGGTFKAGATPGIDISFTLWNVAQRRMLPLPAEEPPGPAPGQPGAEPNPGANPPPGSKEPDQ